LVVGRLVFGAVGPGAGGRGGHGIK
jgi:hypothetical protein